MELTARQRAALELICDTFVPGDGLSIPSAREMNVADVVLRLLDRNPREADRKQLTTLLGIWDTPLMGLLAGAGPRRFSTLSQADREAFLLKMGDSRVGAKRAIFQALKSAALLSYYTTPGPEGEHPVWKEIGYAAPPGPLASAPAPALTPLRPTADTTLDCDVVVVGSGAGGGTAAAVLAEAGLKVVVLERGGYYDDADFGTDELDALTKLYTGGPTATAEGQLTLVAGGCLGGGTVVNWSTSLRTPDDVRAEWAGIGATQFAEAEFDTALDAVERRIGVTGDRSPLSARDGVLERGLTALGWDVGPLPRNVSDACDAAKECGRCGYGCRVGAKQSVTKTWLADAADKGATLVVGADVRTIEVRDGQARAVHAVTAEGAKIRVDARAVVVAAGSIQTPALLLRSGLRNKNIGNYLRLHPASAVFGVFDEEIRPWEGGMQARISRHHRDLGDGYGVIYETGPLHPGMSIGFMNWRGAQAHREIMLDLARTVVVGVITRDRDHGRVSVDKTGEAVVKYQISDRDAANMHVGIGGAAQILEAAGAKRIFSGHQAGGADYAPGVRGSHAEFVAAAAAGGYGPARVGMGALHIMGSARMGGSRDVSATDPDGATWDVPNIVVADASCFPTSSGVNPMVSIEAIAYMNAKRLVARLS